MQKLIIQIPCYNEEKDLPIVLETIPKTIEGIDIIETQIIDDGSTDNTVAVAKKHRVTHILSHIGNKGLGNAFKTGMNNALKQGATLFVNTDADNQYKSSDIPRLVRPILDKQADMVIGNRNPHKVQHFSFTKRILQKIGSKTVQFLCGVEVRDAVSGFRAYSREALMTINPISDYSYTIGTIIQAAKKKIKIVHIDIETNPPTRKSRLYRSTFHHIRKSLAVIFSVYITYEPIKTFFCIGSFFLLIGFIPLVIFFIRYFTGDGAGHIQSLVLGSLFIIMGIQMYGLGIVGNLLAEQRKYTEDILNTLKK